MSCKVIKLKHVTIFVCMYHHKTIATVNINILTNSKWNVFCEVPL